MRSIHMASGMLTFNPDGNRKIFHKGDVIQFYPQIRIDYYDLSIQEDPYLQNVIYDIYKFRFRPIARYSNDLHKNCYHYLIEIFPDFKLFCFNWTKPYGSYLNVGQWYEGHGKLSNCGNASECNKYIPSLIMNSIFITGKLMGIYENLLFGDYVNSMEIEVNQGGDSKNGYCYDDVLNWYGYSKNIDEFNVNVSKHKEQSVVINSTNEIPSFANIIFCVDILA